MNPVSYLVECSNPNNFVVESYNNMVCYVPIQVSNKEKSYFSNE